MGRRSAVAAVAAALLGGLGLLAAGCGGGSKAATTSAATTTAARGNAAAFRAYQSCLKAHGVTIVLPRRTGALPGNGQPPAARTGTTRTTPGARAFGVFANLTAAQRKAAEACRSKLLAGGQVRRIGTNPGSRAANGALATYTQCLARHGVKFGAPNQSAAAFRKAQAACKRLLPGS